MPTKWTTALAQQAKASVSPLRRLKSVKALEMKRQALALQRDMLQRAMDAEQLQNPDGCDAPLPEGTASHVRYMWALTQHERTRLAKQSEAGVVRYVGKNLRVVETELRHARASV